MKKIKIKEIVLCFCFLRIMCFAADKQEKNILKYFFDYATQKNQNYQNYQPIVTSNQKEDLKKKFVYLAGGVLSSLFLLKNKKKFF